MLTTQIYESSRFAMETGAAIHMPPNSNGLLKRMGVWAQATGANECLGVCRIVCLCAFEAYAYRSHLGPQIVPSSRTSYLLTLVASGNTLVEAALMMCVR